MSVLLEIEALLCYSDNWDGHGAKAPTKAAVQAAIGALTGVCSCPGDPTVSASVVGGVMLEWEKPRVELLFHFDEGGNFAALACVDGVDWEGYMDNGYSPEVRQAWIMLHKPSN